MRLFFCLATLLLLFACTDDESVPTPSAEEAENPEETPTDTPTPPALTLLSPGQVVYDSPCDLTFAWESDEEGTFELSVSSGPSFDDIIYETTTQETSVTIDCYHDPNCSACCSFRPVPTYYWRVVQDEESIVGTFSFYNPLPALESSYEIETCHTMWLAGDGSTECYDETLTLEVLSGGGIRVSFGMGVIDHSLSFLNCDSYGRYFYGHNPGFNPSYYFYLDPIAKTVELRHEDGGQIGGDRYEAFFTYE